MSTWTKRTVAGIAGALGLLMLVGCGSGPEAEEPGGGGGVSSGGPSGAAGGSGDRSDASDANDAAGVVGSAGSGDTSVAGPATTEGCDSELWRDGVQVCEDDSRFTCRASVDEADECFLQSDCGKPACKVMPPPGHWDSNEGGSVPDCMCSCSRPYRDAREAQ